MPNAKATTFARPIPQPTDSDRLRFWLKVNKTDCGCWLWVAAIRDTGYGVFKLRRNTYRAHRVAYSWSIGPVDTSLDLDHLCRVRHCVNPSHLEPVTRLVNILRGSHPSAVAHRNGTCLRGHLMSPENTITFSRPQCRTCYEAALSRRYQREAQNG